MTKARSAMLTFMRSEEHRRSAEATLTRNEDEGLASGTYSVTIAATRVVHGVDLDIERLDVGPYLQNPVVMLQHGFAESSLPIARTTRLIREGGALRAHFVFNDADPLARRVRQAWDAGFINAASISWREDSQGTSDGKVRQRMVEWSVVPIPADIKAIRGEMMEPDNESKAEDKPEADSNDGAVTRADVEELKAALREVIPALKRVAQQAEQAEETAPAESVTGERAGTIPADKLEKVAGDLGVKDTKGMSVRQVLEAALGDERPEGDYTDEALWGMAVAIHLRRERAKADVVSTSTSQAIPTLRGWTAQHIIDMEAN